MITLYKEIRDVVELIKQEIREFADYLPRIVQEDPNLFTEHLRGKLDFIDAMSRCCPEDRGELMQFCVRACAPELTQSLIQRQCIEKPLGYAGDFQVIDWIYDYRSDSPGRGRLWDELFQAQAAPQAVRSRKDFFVGLYTSICQQTPASRSVLDIACGSCREVTDAVDQAGILAEGTRFHCVDIEPKAIACAQDRARDLKGVSFQWETANVLRIRPSCQYDLVWSAGLFDYLNDRLATLLLKRMWSWTKAGGTCAIGNYHPSNPSRNYMEWCGDWYLIHRTDDDMRRLCRDAGIPPEQVTITHESLGVCVFALLTK